MHIYTKSPLPFFVRLTQNLPKGKKELGKEGFCF